jgi:hypothetical protein
VRVSRFERNGAVPTRPGLVGVALCGLLTLGPGCDTHTGPSEGVTVYEDPDFRGSSRTFDGNSFDLQDIRGPCFGFLDTSSEGSWDDCISSIRVPSGWEITLYEDDRYEGRNITLSADVRDLEELRGPCGDDWDDCVSSIRVRAP